MTTPEAIEAVGRAILNKASTNGIDLDGVPDYGYPEASASLLAQAAIAAYHKHLEAQGMVVVPREPSEAQIFAARRATGPSGFRGYWRAMLKAAE